MIDPDTLPYSTEAEQSVLGALLLDWTALDRVPSLRAKHFFTVRHGWIFDAIGALVLAGKAADPISVLEQLRDLEQDEDAGGMEYLSALSMCVPSAAQIERHADIVRDRYVQRALIESCDQALAVAQSTAPLPERLDKIATMFAQLQAQQTRREPRLIADVVRDRLQHYEDLNEGRVLAGWPIGIPGLDRILGGGLKPGKVYIVAARPSVGKSSLAQWIALRMAAQELPTLFLSQEMPEEELADRAVSSTGRIDLERLTVGGFESEDYTRLVEATTWLSGKRLYVDDQPALTIADVKAKCRSVRGLRVLVLDYLQLCQGAPDKDTRNGQIEEISRAMKGLAKDLGAAVLVLSQLNRQVESRPGRRPLMSDLRDSGAIEQDADVVALLWKHADWTERTIVGCDIAKHRGGKTGQLALDFVGATQRWGESIASLEPIKQRDKGGFE